MRSTKKGNTITVTKRGRVVATLGPAKKKRLKSPEWMWVGKVKIVGDVVTFETADLWNVLRDPRADGRLDYEEPSGHGN